MKNVFKSFVGLICFAVTMAMFTTTAQAATPGVYDLTSSGTVIDVANVNYVSKYDANSFRIKNSSDGSLTDPYTDTSLVVFNKIKLDPNFIAFGDILVNMATVRSIIQVYSNQVEIQWFKGGVRESIYDSGLTGWAAAKAAAN